MRLLDKHSGHRHLRCKAMAVAIATVSTVIMIFPLSGNAQADDMNGNMTEGKASSMVSMEMHKAMMSGMKEMESMPMTGDPDHDFAMMMKKHHQSAIDMAKEELEHGKDLKIKTMAKEIISSQQIEINEFQQWLKQHKTAAQPMSK